MDLMICSGTIVDGTGKDRYVADIVVRNGRIAWIGEHGAAFYDGNDDKIHVIDAAGLVVCPGFIDVHSHNDLVPLMDDEIQDLKLHQGVTTELVGQCGLGVIPCMEEDEIWRNYTRGVVGEPKMNWSFADASSYFEQLESCGMKNNFAILLSHGAVRTKVMGFDTTAPSEEQLDRMCKIVDNAMRAGAFGLSLGLQYMPGIFSTREELIRLCTMVKQYDGIVMVHLRNHDSTIVAAMQEIISIARVSGVKLHISHLRSYASEVYGCSAKELLRIVDEASATGVNITFDEHLYLSGSTLLTQLLPPWVSEGGAQQMLERLRSPEVRARIARDLENPDIHYAGWDNYYGVTGWENVLITSVRNVENKSYIGHTLLELAARTGEAPLDFMARLVVEEQGGVGIVTHNVFSEEDTIELIQHPLQMVGSDSIPAGTPHPRLYGNYPLFIGKFAREKQALSLERAIHKCTQLPARVLGIKDRGELSVGKLADIMIFDFDEMEGFEDYGSPRRKPLGVTHVIIGGHIAVEKGVTTEVKAGCIVAKDTSR